LATSRKPFGALPALWRQPCRPAGVIFAARAFFAVHFDPLTTNGKSVHSHHSLAQHDLRRVAVAGQCDPRTVVRYLLGDETMSSTTTARVESALAACGYGRLVRPPDH
jgi:hypothetical protein